MDDAHTHKVAAFLTGLQERLCQALESLEPSQRFERDGWERALTPGADASGLGGRGITAIIEDGTLLERGGVALSDIRGASLPAAATARHPELAGRSYRAQGVSVVMHPRNPHVPTGHMNVRHFSAGDTWWFGGGFDLTPYLPYEEDVRQWHHAAAAACAPFGPGLYAHARAHCDEYFLLKHRGEARGVGGLFYDDLNEATPQLGMSWERCFEFMQRVGNAYADTYCKILQQRHTTPSTDRERRYQLYRRGRYVEFNLVFDRGTLFGLQSGGRTDAILMSMPPRAEWSYRSPDPELDARLLPYLTTRRGEDWLV
jgi:coproporphyrinogen III oxidase